MNPSNIETIIDDAWERRAEVGAETGGELRAAVDVALNELDAGLLRVAEKVDGEWRTNQWLKKAVLLSFRLYDAAPIPGGPGGNSPWFDKVRSKFEGWDDARFRAAGFPGGAPLRGAPLGLYRARRGADALFRQHRRLRRFGHHDRHLGDRGKPAPRSARTAISRAAPASAACSNPCRPGQ